MTNFRKLTLKFLILTRFNNKYANCSEFIADEPVLLVISHVTNSMRAFLLQLSVECVLRYAFMKTLRDV